MATVWSEKYASNILRVALKYLGQCEVPPGSNRGPIPDRCFAFVHGADADPTLYTVPEREWCAEFACTVVFAAGVTNFLRTASTGALYEWGKAHNSTLLTPRMGDIACVIDPNSPTGFRHTLLVEHNLGDGMIHCVAGNEGNCVKRSIRPIDTMKYVRPYHAEKKL